jgi:hypothetical protein
MKTILTLALALATTACGQLSPRDSSVAGVGDTTRTSTSATVTVNAPAAPEVTPNHVVEQASGTWSYEAITCDFGTRLCDDGSVVGFDSVGPIVVSPTGDRSLTTWAEWTQAE